MPETLRRTSSKKKKKHDTSPQTPLFVGLVAAVVGTVWYLRKRAKKESEGTKKSTRSAFKFPDATKQSSLPRNSKSTNNKKKNKAKRRAEKAQKKAEKEKVTKTKGQGKQEQGQASTSVMNYTYFDTARRDTVIPTHKKPSLSAADVMKKDQDVHKP